MRFNGFSPAMIIEQALEIVDTFFVKDHVSENEISMTSLNLLTINKSVEQPDLPRSFHPEPNPLHPRLQAVPESLPTNTASKEAADETRPRISSATPV